MKGKKKAGTRIKKKHHLRAKRKGSAKGRKMYKIGRNNRNVRLAAVQAQPEMTLQERSLSKIWDNQYDEAWNKYAPVSSS